MRIKPNKKVKVDLYVDLNPVQKTCRKVAIVVVFLGVYIWLLKIVFIG
jgi:hypothetical protein